MNRSDVAEVKEQKEKTNHTVLTFLHLGVIRLIFIYIYFLKLLPIPTLSSNLNTNTNIWRGKQIRIVAVRFTLTTQSSSLYNRKVEVDFTALLLTPASATEAPGRCSAPAKRRCFPKCSWNTNTVLIAFKWKHFSALTNVTIKRQRLTVW